MLNWQDHIESKPEILYGKPVIKNTRIPVDMILKKITFGDSIQDLLDAYQNLKMEDIQSCLLFASDTIKNEVIYLKASLVKGGGRCLWPGLFNTIFLHQPYWVSQK